MKQKEQVSCNSWSKDRKWLTYDEENTVILNYMGEEDNWTFLLIFARLLNIIFKYYTNELN
jgi:hypothetical protein